MWIKSLSSTSRFPPLVWFCSWGLRRPLHRSRPRQCNTSCPSAPALQPLRVAPKWCRLSSQQKPRCQRLNQLPSPSPADHARPDATLRSARDPGPRLCWTQHLGRLPDLRYRKRRGLSPVAAGPPLKKPLLCLLAPRSIPGADGRVFAKNTVVNIRSFHIAPTQTYSHSEHCSSYPYHEPQAPVRQPAAQNTSTPRHMSRGLAGHPRSVRLGSGDNKTRLHHSICSQTPAVSCRGLHISSAQHGSRPLHRSDELAGERSRGNSSPSSEWVRLLQPLLPRPQDGWGSKAHSKSQTSESRPYEMAIQYDHIETDPFASIPRGLVIFTGSERRLFSHSDSPIPQVVLEIRLWGSGLSIHGPSLWAVPSSPHFYEVHGCGSFSAETAGNQHLQLPRRLAHPGPVGGWASISQICAPQPRRVPRTQGQFC